MSLASIGVTYASWRSGDRVASIVIPIMLRHRKTVFLRLPLPYRIGEVEAPGNVEGKLRTEIATYIWLEEHFPDVPIPTLHAFGPPGGQTVSH